MACFVMMLTSCKDLKKNNPYDPDGTAYAGITYKGQVSYPDGTDIKAMLVQNGMLVFAAYSPVNGYCVMKMTGDNAYYAVGSTGDTPGTFRYISDICSDSSGNIYVVDNKNYVQTISPANVMGSWPIVYTTGIDNLSIECLNDNIFISNNLDKSVTKYTSSGTFVDSLTLSFTSYGNFIPGKIFKGVDHIYVINAADTSVIVKLTDTLVNSGEYKFTDNIIDGCAAGEQIQMAAPQTVYKVDSNLVIGLKWGDFGVGPGRILNGKLAAYDAISGTVYILDGLTIKKFGE
jgi:hypothetical protein